jgi:hypothetical protein
MTESPQPQSGAAVVRRLDEMPNTSAPFYHFSVDGARLVDGLLLEVTHSDARWIGLFSRGETAFDGFVSLRDSTLFVVSGGQGYLVDSRCPARYRSGPSRWLNDLASDEKTPAWVVTCDPWQVFLIRTGGAAFALDLNSDGIQDLRIRGEVVEGVCDRIGGTIAPFRIRLGDIACGATLLPALVHARKIDAP